MERPVEYLKRERTLRDVSLESVHEATCVSIKLLAALEADDYETLPHPAFVKGFIQSYAKHLGLDETEAVLRYELFLREESQHEDSGPPKGWQTEDSGSVALKSSKTIQVLVAVGIVVMIIMYLNSFRDGTDDLPVASRTSLPEVATPELVTPEVEVAAVKPAVKPKIKPAVKIEAKPAVKLEAKPEAKPEVKSEAKPEVNEAAQTAIPPTIAPPALAPKVSKGHRLVVRAKEDAWVEVAIDGGEPFDVLLKTDERVVWKADKGFSLVLGNAGGVALEFDGEELQLHGESGRVVRLMLPDKYVPVVKEPDSNDVFDQADNF